MNILQHKANRAFEIWREKGFTGIRNHFKRLYLNWHEPRKYQKWIQKYDRLTDADRERIRREINNFDYRPLISIVMPVYDIDEKWLRLCIESVLKQLYTDWELCIADDCSTKPHVRSVLEEYAAQDERIKVVFRAENGHISAASNSALELASGEFVALLDHDDELSEHALYVIAAELNAFPQTDMIYSDEDMIDQGGNRFVPRFKPDWSPDLFYSLNLITHLSFYRTEILRKIGGFRLGCEGSQDYDLALRVIEQIPEQNIRHVPYVLYHWRAIPGSVAFGAGEKSYAHDRARQAIALHFERTGEKAEIVEGFGYLHRAICRPPKPEPLVSLIIYSENKPEILRKTIHSITQQTDYSNFEILIVCGGENYEAITHLSAEFSKDSKIKMLKSEAKNSASAKNYAASQAQGEVLCFLENGVQILSGEWLGEMSGHASRERIGAVGAKLFYPDNTIRHGGYVLGVKGIVGNAHRFLPEQHQGHFLRAKVINNVSAVSGACLAVKRDIFDANNGFDERNLPNGLYDADFCLRLGERKLRILWTPYSKLYQLYDSPTEKIIYGSKKDAPEIIYFKQKWGHLFSDEQYYNQNLTLSREDCSVALPHRFPDYGNKFWKLRKQI